MDRQKNEKFKPLDKNSRFDRFILEYTEFLKGNHCPERISRDLKYSFEMQNRRLLENDVHVEAAVESRTVSGSSRLLRCWENVKYRGSLEYKSVYLNRIFSCGSKKKIHIGRRELFYRTETDLQAGCPSENEYCNCPSCGAPIRMGQLADTGCSYCFAKFTRAQLFPMTTNYYITEDLSGIKEQRKGRIWIFLGLPMLFAILMAIVIGIASIPYALSGPVDSDELLTVVFAWAGQQIRKIPHLLLSANTSQKPFIAGVLFPVAVFVFWSLFVLTKLFWKAGKGLLTVWCIPSKKRFEKLMKELYPEYSFDYFTDKVTGLYRMLIFAPKPEDCLAYSGKKLSESRKNIMHSDFTGALGIRKVYQKDGLCFVKTTAYADTVRKSGRRFWRERDRIELELCRKTEAKVDLGFSPFRIVCKSCGASFDAVKDKTCPYCGTVYENDYSDWTVRSIHIKKIGFLSYFISFLTVIFGPPLFMGLLFYGFPLLIPCICFIAYYSWKNGDNEYR